MFRGLVLRVRPSQQQILDLPFQPSTYAVSKKCNEETQADAVDRGTVTETECVCRCCSFTFEIIDEQDLLKVPVTIWNEVVVWRKIQNPIGLDQFIPSDFPLNGFGIINNEHQQNYIPSRIPGFPYNRTSFYSASTHGGHEVVIDLKTGKVNEATSPVKRMENCPSKIRIPRLIIMGSGGTGCEILKTLFLRGFHAFTVVDRDTIDLSNLNRQLLFSTEDIGRSKAQASVELFQHAIYQSKFYKSICSKGSDSLGALKCYASEFRFLHGDIESFFKIEHPVPPFSAYSPQPADHHVGPNMMLEDLCYSALDNIPTRKYINRLSYFMGKPIIESGVSGFNGQVQPICVDCANQCYDCQGIKSSDQANTFAVCTIHAKPTKLVHCVHYAQELYAFLLKASTSAEAVASEFDELSTAVRGAFQDTSEGKPSLCAAMVELFDFMCSQRVTRKVDSTAEVSDAEPTIEEMNEPKRMRLAMQHEPPVNFPSNGPAWTDFEAFVSPIIDGSPIYPAIESSTWKSHPHHRFALALYIHSIACIAGAVPGEQTPSQHKRTKANFIYAVTFLRCMVFHIPIEDRFRNFSRSDGLFWGATSTIHSICTRRRLPDPTTFQSFLDFFLDAYQYTGNPLYMHIESISMRIIPSVSSANAIVGAFAVSMGTKALFHIHYRDAVLYSSGNRRPRDDCQEATSPAQHCHGDYLRHIHIRASPLEARSSSFDLVNVHTSIEGKTDTKIETNGKRRRKSHKMTIYSHPLYRSSAACETCAPYHHHRSYSILVDATRLSVGDLIRHVVEKSLSINDPIIDIVLSACFSAEQEARTLYEDEEFEQNSCELLSKWMDLEGSSPLRLTVSSTAHTSLRFPMTIYHDSETRLPPDALIVRCFEPPRWNRHAARIAQSDESN
ncbi:ubiquitin-activating enzyme-like protein [Perkinsela sp. CCAP 1560/4]|nr:ubiquitin-activating enzyme-like protein [Perkinsela sp. CCAP 1560/4]|eukprot:KNH07734.1 ubiquitin-activating enzyme-like protein [Perkinsela sp. CCAP 1560/4]